jgi:hypothetical protein
MFNLFSYYVTFHSTHFLEHSREVDIYTHMSILPILASSKNWIDLILIFMKSITKNVSLSMRTSHTTKKIISPKYTILMPNLKFESK